MDDITGFYCGNESLSFFFFTSFEEWSETLGVRPELVANLRAQGYAQPTPIQMQAVPLMLQRREILACAPTGSGKVSPAPSSSSSSSSGSDCNWNDSVLGTSGKERQTSKRRSSFARGPKRIVSRDERFLEKSAHFFAGFC